MRPRRIYLISGLALLALPKFTQAADRAQAEFNIEKARQIIMAGCGLTSKSQTVQATAGINGSLTLRKLPTLGATAGVTLTKTEGEGLVTTIQKQITRPSVDLAKAQIACMQPWIEKLWSELNPRTAGTYNSTNELQLYGDIRERLRKLYSPLYAQMTDGEAQWRRFSEDFNSRFGRTSPIQWETVNINGRVRERQIPMSDVEWNYWMKWVDAKARPENQKLASLINNNAHLVIGGVMTPCMKELLLHSAAFEESYSLAKADPKLRTWQSRHDWPRCIEGETEKQIGTLLNAH